MAMASSSPNPAAPAELQQARQLAQAGRIADAEALYRRLLALEPAQLEALNFLGVGALMRGELAGALELFERARQIQPNDPLTLKNLGGAYADAGRMEEGEALLRQAVAAAPDFLAARLTLGQVVDALGRRGEAVQCCFAAIVRAQRRGQWRNQATTPAALREIVPWAIGMVRDHRRQLFSAALAPLQARHGSTAVARVAQALSMYLGDLPITYADPRQRPKFLYIPGLPTTPYLPRERMGWLSQLEAAFAPIREELLQVLAAGPQSLQPFLELRDGAPGEQYLQGSRGKPQWDAFFFYRHGRRYDDNCARCPQTAAALEGLPLMRLREHGPEVCFSVLTPGTRIMPHYGVTNSRVVVHLPLVVPPDCALRVGGEIHAWREGQAVSFDDTFEHEAWNNSDQVRTVLIIDAWNPWLSAEECVAIHDLVLTIGDFNQRCELDAMT